MGRLAAQEALDGLMLGDGSLGRYKPGICFKMDLSKPLCSRSRVNEELRELSLAEHIEYECWIRDNVFNVMGIEARGGHPIVLMTSSHGKPYKYASFASKMSMLLIGPYTEWYTGGEWIRPQHGSLYIRGALKVLPNRLVQSNVIPARTLAHWFIGDGGVTERRGAGFVSVYLSLATEKFSRAEVWHLIAMLNSMDIHSTKPSQDKNAKGGSGLTILVAQDSVNRFMDLVEPYIFEIFGDSGGRLYKDHLIKRKG